MRLRRNPKKAHTQNTQYREAGRSLWQLAIRPGYWLFAVLVLLNSCDYRRSSKDRFEEITQIELPDSIKVLQDRFEESGTDYGLFYKVSLNQKNCLEMLGKIQKSNGWVEKQNEWTCYKTVDGIIYNITFSIENCQIVFNEDLI